MSTHSSRNRRDFLKGMIAAAAAPVLVPAHVLKGQNSPSKTIQLGHIGTGGQGTANLRNFLSVDGAASVAICDPYKERRERAAGFVREAQGHDPKLYNDYREMLADRGVDAVVISTPDHWHVPVALEAIRAGKDLYLEKPLGYTLAQNRMVFEALKKHERVFQYGTQQRSSEMIKRGVELVLNGYIGDVKRIDVWAPGGRTGGSMDEIPVPPGLDYELYIGPAPMRPCTTDRITNVGSWYCADYAIGFIAGWGAHPLDVAIWGSQSDTKGPVRFKGKGSFPPATDLCNTCSAWDVDVGFGDGVSMHFMSTDVAEPVVQSYLQKMSKNAEGQAIVENNGTTFFGTKGWVSLSRDTAQASNPAWLKLRQCEGSQRVLYRNHYYRAFVESVRDRGSQVAPIGDAFRSDAISHLSLISIRSGQEIVWDPQAYRIVSPEPLNSEMSKPSRGSYLRDVQAR
jgi:predicted dehydrogenase